MERVYFLKITHLAIFGGQDIAFKKNICKQQINWAGILKFDVDLVVVLPNVFYYYLLLTN